MRRNLLIQIWCILVAVLAAAGAPLKLHLLDSLPTSETVAEESLESLSRIGEALKELDKLQNAIDQIKLGKRPTFDSPLDKVAEKWKNYADTVEKLDIDFGSPPSAHQPGHAIEEIQLNMRQLRWTETELKELRNRLVAQKRIIAEKMELADRWTRSLESLPVVTATEGELRPLRENTIEGLIVELRPALSQCEGSTKGTIDRIDKQLSQLKIRIADKEAWLADPTTRQVILMIDQSQAVLAKKLNDSVHDQKSAVQNNYQDGVSAGQLSISNAQHQPPPAPHQNSDGTWTFPILKVSPNGVCPSGTIRTKEGYCVSATISTPSPQ